jgi:ATP-dependent Zn protease
MLCWHRVGAPLSRGVRWLTERTNDMNKTWRRRILSLFTCFVLTVPQVVDAAEETSREIWETLLINWFPMLLLVGVWIYFMRNMRKQPGKWQSGGGEEMNQHLEKIEQSLERIARALEKK